MNERLREIVDRAFEKFSTADGQLRAQLVTDLQAAGVTLPPEPEIPIPEKALDAFSTSERTSGDWRENFRIGLRAAYPHIVAAVIDALRNYDIMDLAQTGQGAFTYDYDAGRRALHRALRSAKAAP